MTILIHVGYMKTGSTWLQAHLFNNVEAGFGMPIPKIWYNRKITQPNELDFDPDEARAYFREKIETVRRQGLVPVLSSERFCGSNHGGGYDTAIVARRLKAMYPEALILLIIREQKSMMLSAYKEFVNEGGLLSPKEYFEPPYFSPHLPHFEFSFLAYDRIIRCYQELFGAENILVLPFEMLRTEPKDYASRIITFAGGKDVPDLPFDRSENKSRGAGTYVFRRWFNPLIIRSPLNGFSSFAPPYKTFPKMKPMFDLIDGLIPNAVHRSVESRWKDYIRGLAKGRYEQSNLEASRLLGINLGDYGYTLPGGEKHFGRDGKIEAQKAVPSLV